MVNNGNEYTTLKKVTSIALVLAVLLALAACVRPGIDREAQDGESKEYDFRIFFGSDSDPIAVTALLDRYENETGLAVEPIYYESATVELSVVERLLDGDDPAAAFAVPVGDVYEKLALDGYVADPGKYGNDFKGRLVGEDGRRVLWSSTGRGFIAKKSLLIELLSVTPSGADAAIAAVRNASYEEWSDFVDKADGYIVSGSSAQVTLSGLTFSFPGKKSAALAELNGVFAAAGRESAATGDYMMAPLLAGNENARLFSLRELPPEQALPEFSKVTEAYVQSLDLLTSHLAGYYAPGIRGTSFGDSSAFDNEHTASIFAGGRALFILGDETLPLLSAEGEVPGDDFIMLPTKYPYAAVGLDEAGRNTKIVGSATGYFCVNAYAEEEKQRMGADFIEWLCGESARSLMPLQASINEYVISGAVMADPARVPVSEFAGNGADTGGVSADTENAEVSPPSGAEGDAGSSATTEEEAELVAAGEAKRVEFMVAYFEKCFREEDGIKAWLTDVLWSPEDREALKAKLSDRWFA